MMIVFILKLHSNASVIEASENKIIINKGNQ